MDRCYATTSRHRRRFPRMRGDGPSGCITRPTRPWFPPHARGWTVYYPDAAGREGVSPACAGMDPCRPTSSRSRQRFPRMRGDGPRYITPMIARAEFPPHARGWTHAESWRVGVPLVSPACAGMDRLASGHRGPLRRFPRMRGDGPIKGAKGIGPKMFPPHARGWTLENPFGVRPAAVSPACAGMDPFVRPVHSDDARFPRMRGDGPGIARAQSSETPFPPHARGWTPAKFPKWSRQSVSPACAGMDPGLDRR